jgi:hypothetical protein
MAFTSYLYISIGETNALFTLRHAYAFDLVAERTLSAHIVNLSQNADDAIRKAKLYAEAQGIELRANANILREQMREIKRATQAQLEYRAAKAKEEEMRQAAQRAAYEQSLRDIIATGKYPFGQFKDKMFDEASSAYVNWLMSSINEYDEGSVMHDLIKAVTAECSYRRFPEPDAELLIGQPKKRQDFEVIVVRSAFFVRQSWSGTERVYVTTMVSAEGACLVSFSSSFAPHVGDKMTIKATVKDHSNYNGQAQTIVQRVKILKSLYTYDC